jgi:hypothetical protein
MLTLKAAVLMVTCFTGPGAGDYTNEPATYFEQVNGAIRYERVSDGAEVVTTQACYATTTLNEPIPAERNYLIQCFTDGVRRIYSTARSYRLLGDGLVEWEDVEENSLFLAGGSAGCRIEPYTGGPF